ncbi:MAG: ABC transporter ATP-binding protein [Acidobacteria bacterium]|nr:ABC transporter ATP-binding protein [Acidobacteriota bacterium]
MTAPALRFDGVAKYYESEGTRVAALDGITLDFAAGRFVALVGRSGCGKSTLLNLAGAMDLPSAGEVWIGGQAASRLSDGQLTALRRHRIGFVFQFFQLMPTLPVVENVELPALLAGLPGAREKALEKLRWVELESLAGRYPHQLSGGQAQRVAIARALVNSPSLLLADEPIGNLDTATGTVVLELLRRAAREQGALVVMATHSHESTQYCDRVVRLRDGHVESAG